MVHLAGYLRKVHPPIADEFYPKIWNLLPALLQSATDIREHEPIAMLAKRISLLECVLLVFALSRLERGEREI